ncbi:MAG TPA: divalent-cation tolerance protein CutA [Chitinispirillaceae bacterium]|nr:divalent-cation tolerance protein CutA [Chitinispirillaceae bacterium]
MLFVYITTRDKEQARSIGRVLVEEHLAACVNIINGMESIYYWKNSICEDTETILIAKTHEDRLIELTQRVKSLHSYECPCIVALPITGGNQEYLNWIAASTRKQ